MAIMPPYNLFTNQFVMNPNQHADSPRSQIDQADLFPEGALLPLAQTVKK